MTDKVNPSINRPAEAFKTAGAIALAGGADPGYITEAANPSQISVQDSGIDDTQFNAFAETSTATSFDVTIDPGEAFVYGAWLAIDVSTTVTLSSSTTDQTVYVGWNKNSSDDVIVGLQADFDNASGNVDQKIPLYTFDTDGSGVISVSDERIIGANAMDTQFQQATIPFSQIPNGDNASARAYIASGETLQIWQAGVQESTQTSTAGLTVEVEDLTNNVTIYSTTSKKQTDFPLASKDGPIDVSFKVANATGSQINASGFVVYTSD